MAQVTLPYTLTAGTPENVNNLVSNLNALVTGVNTIDTAQIATGAVTTTQILDATIVAADIANSTITAAKLAPGVGGTALTVGSVTATTERTTTSTTWVDVTSASFSLTVASNSVTIVSIAAELKASGAFVYSFMNALIGSSAYIIDPGLFTDTEPNLSNYLGAVENTTYRKRTFSGGIHSSQSGTGAQTVKVRFAASSGTAYIKNVYLSAVNIPL